MVLRLKKQYMKLLRLESGDAVVVLSEKELMDVRTGLLVGMKALDDAATEGSSDKATSDRIESIYNVLSAPY